MIAYWNGMTRDCNLDFDIDSSKYFVRNWCGEKWSRNTTQLRYFEIWNSKRWSKYNARAQKEWSLCESDESAQDKLIIMYCMSIKLQRIKLNIIISHFLIFKSATMKFYVLQPCMKESLMHICYRNKNFIICTNEYRTTLETSTSPDD